jgi:hypothetical protein
MTLMRLLTVGVAFFALGCQCGVGAVLPDSGSGAGTAAGAGDSGAGGSGGGDGTGASGGAGGSQVCPPITSTATLDKRPVDIIMVIDNSGSMTDEIVAVEANVNSNFATIIANSGLDYRIILISKHGSARLAQSVCIGPPLSGNATCMPPPPQPTNGARFFHYSTQIGSTNSLQKIISTYNAAGRDGTAPNGWSGWLRDGAYRTFIEITDDNEMLLPATEFEQQLTALMPARFGTVQNRNYVFHSIVGVQAKANPAEAYQPTEGLVNSKCPSAVNPGLRYQELSRSTNGLRFQMCEPSLYGTVFQAVAQGVVASAQVACDFAVPSPPAGFTLANRIYVTYTPSNGGPATEFLQIPNSSTCAANSFYVQNGRVIFCPQACQSVRMDTMAQVSVRFTCEAMIQ